MDDAFITQAFVTPPVRLALHGIATKFNKR